MAGTCNKVFNDLHRLQHRHLRVVTPQSDTGDGAYTRGRGTPAVVIEGSRIVHLFAGGDAEDVFNDLHLLDTSFFRTMEAAQQGAGGGAPDDDAEAEGGQQQRASGVPHSMSAPTSPSSHARRSLSSEQQQQPQQQAAQGGADDGGEWEGEGGPLCARLDECASQLGSLVSASLQRLEYRQRQADSEEAELLRLLQAMRERRLADYRQTADDVTQLQEMIAQHIADIKDDISSAYARGGSAASSSSSAPPPAPPPPVVVAAAASSSLSAAAAGSRPKKSPRKRSGKAAAQQPQHNGSAAGSK